MSASEETALIKAATGRPVLNDEEKEPITKLTKAPKTECAYCGAPNGRLCTTCHDIYYCGRACQRADWPIHKLLCASLAAFTSVPRPDPHYQRAILFPADEPAPRFVWLWSLTPEEKDYSGLVELPVTCASVEDVSRRARTADTQPLWLAYSQRADAVAANTSIPRLAVGGASAALCFRWYGNVVAVGRAGDVNTRDFRAIADYLLCHPHNLALVAPARYAGAARAALKVHCAADARALGAPALQRVWLGLDADTAGYAVLPLTARLRPPLRVRKLDSGVGGDAGADTRNPVMLPFLDFFLEQHGAVPLEKIHSMRIGGVRNLGSFMLSQLVEAPLCPEHVWLICDFVFRAAAQVAGGSGAQPVVERDKLVEALNMDAFDAFWKDAEKEGKIKGLKSPFPR